VAELDAAAVAIASVGLDAAAIAPAGRWAPFVRPSWMLWCGRDRSPDPDAARVWPTGMLRWPRRAWPPRAPRARGGPPRPPHDLRYAAITPELVAEEYQSALARLAAKYRLPSNPASAPSGPGASPGYLPAALPDNRPISAVLEPQRL
jgi:hypothetical protein